MDEIWYEDHATGTHPPNNEDVGTSENRTLAYLIYCMIIKLCMAIDYFFIKVVLNSVSVNEKVAGEY
jgi:hypothetical protein